MSLERTTADHDVFRGGAKGTTLESMVKLSLTAVFEPVDEGWTQARIAEIPGVITAAPSRKEAQEMLLDALREYFLSFQEKSPTATQGLDSSRVEILLTG